jgi:hypothetical protein
MKHQIPSHQQSNHDQGPHHLNFVKSKSMHGWIWVIGYYLELGVWGLGME